MECGVPVQVAFLPNELPPGELGSFFHFAAQCVMRRLFSAGLRPDRFARRGVPPPAELWSGGHIKFWSRKTLTQLLADSGFINIRFEGLGSVPYVWKSMQLAAEKQH
jgi:hypothetical protein